MFNKCVVKTFFNDSEIQSRFYYPNGYCVQLTCNNVEAAKENKIWRIEILEYLSESEMKPTDGISLCYGKHDEAVRITTEVQYYPAPTKAQIYSLPLKLQFDSISKLIAS